MILSKAQLAAIKAEEYNRGYTDGRKSAVLIEETRLKQLNTDLLQRARALDGSVLLAKCLVEQLALAGIPAWINQKH